MQALQAPLPSCRPIEVTESSWTLSTGQSPHQGRSGPDLTLRDAKRRSHLEARAHQITCIFTQDGINTHDQQLLKGRASQKQRKQGRPRSYLRLLDRPAGSKSDESKDHDNDHLWRHSIDEECTCIKQHSSSLHLTRPVRHGVGKQDPIHLAHLLPESRRWAEFDRLGILAVLVICLGRKVSRGPQGHLQRMTKMRMTHMGHRTDPLSFTGLSTRLPASLGVIKILAIRSAYMSQRQDSLSALGHSSAMLYCVLPD